MTPSEFRPTQNSVIKLHLDNNVGPCDNLTKVASPRSRFREAKRWRPPWSVNAPRSSVCLMDLPVLRTIPFLHGNGLAGVPFGTGMDLPARTRAGLRPSWPAYYQTIHRDSGTVKMKTWCFRCRYAAHCQEGIKMMYWYGHRVGISIKSKQEYVKLAYSTITRDQNWPSCKDLTKVHAVKRLPDVAFKRRCINRKLQIFV